jgi:hypothetical protein
MTPAPRHLRSFTALRRALICACGAGYLLGHVPLAMSQDSAKKVSAGTSSQDTTKKGTAKAAPDTAQTRKPEELDALVAPVALYSDDLLAQTLVASTYPLEIVQLHQWLAKNPGLKDKALADSVAKQPWDPSIQSMAAIPEVVKRLSDDIQWTTELGNAFLGQQADVMAAVQRMRKKAKDKGALKTNEQQKVETKVVEQKQVIVVESQNPEVVYVPSYSPTVVYGAPLYYPYPPIYYPPYTAGAAFVSFGVGMMWGAAMWGGACCHSHWGGGNVYINHNNNFNRNVNRNTNRNTNINGGRGGTGGRGGGNTWQHNPQHRGGAPYADQRTANRYGGSTRGQNQARAGANNRTSTMAQGQRGTGASDRSAAGGQRSGGAGDRSAGGGMSAGNRSSGAGGSGIGGDPIGNRSIPKDTGRSSGGWGGGGYNGGSARASSSRGASSMRGGGGMSRGGGGRRR